MLYEIELPPDGSRFRIGRPPYNVGCQRRDKLYTNQCFPCTMPFANVSIGHVDCVFEPFNEDGTKTPSDMEHGPVQLVYGAPTKLLSFQCYRQSAGEKISLSMLKTDHTTRTTEASIHELEPWHPETPHLLEGETGGVFLMIPTVNRIFVEVPADMQYYSLAGNSP